MNSSKNFYFEKYFQISSKVHILTFIGIVIVLINDNLFQFLGAFTNVVHTTTLILGAFVLFNIALIFFIVVFLGGFLEIKKLFIKPKISGEGVIYGKKIIDMKGIDSIWIFDNVYWLCPSNEETNKMEKAVKMQSDDPPVVVHFSTDKIDLGQFLKDRTKHEFEDVTWYQK